jgi:competence ComEA-like helix-hairpin-helix protein
MPQEKDLSRIEQQATMRLWMRGCFIAAAAGMIGLAVFSARLYARHQRPFLAAIPERINPNTAPIGSLVRLEGIGRARAMDIIHYRQTHQHNGPAFESAEDLENISGIGPKTVEKMSPWLIFDENFATN